MVAQLSTSGTVSQHTIFRALSTATRVLILLIIGTTVQAQGSGWEQPSEVERRIDPLSAIDRQFMAGQRSDVDALANRLGQRLTGDPARDLETLQAILDRGLVGPDDALQLQALGIVLGDLLGKKLDMDWVVYRDRAGRSRALRYREMDIFLFPVTMISRRREAGNLKPVSEIYRDVVAATQPKLPGAKWR